MAGRLAARESLPARVRGDRRRRRSTELVNLLDGSDGAFLTRAILAYVRESLPPAPARVLEVGAGDGELAAALRSAGYDVVAIDPASTTDSVRAVSLHELSEPAGSFDAAVAVVSMHHVEPLRRSCRLLAEVVRPGGTLVLDEIDVERFDDSAEHWWLENRPPHQEHDGHEPPVPGSVVAFLRHHCHDLRTMEDALVDEVRAGPNRARAVPLPLGARTRVPRRRGGVDRGRPAAGGRRQGRGDPAARPGVKQTAWQRTPSPISSASSPSVLRSWAISS